MATRPLAPGEKPADSGVFKTFVNHRAGAFLERLRPTRRGVRIRSSREPARRNRPVPNNSSELRGRPRRRPARAAAGEVSRCGAAVRDELDHARRAPRRSAPRRAPPRRLLPRRPATSAPRSPGGAAGRGAEVALGHEHEVGHLHDPAFMNCSASPEPGWTQSSTRSAQSAISVSDWPTPTVSTSTQSKRPASAPPPGRQRGEAAEVPARRHGADEDARVVGVAVDAGAVAEKGAARDRPRTDRRRRPPPSGPPREVARSRRW